jgi:hypothetical protein
MVKEEQLIAVMASILMDSIVEQYHEQHKDAVKMAKKILNEIRR